MAAKKPPELVDTMAEYMDVEIIDRAAFADAINRALISWIAPRLYSHELIKRGIISPKKASDDARGTREAKE